MRFLIYIISFIPFCCFSQISINGNIYDFTTHAPIRYGTVALLKDGKIVKGVETNLEGYFEFEKIPAGKYELEASYVGYAAKRIKCLIYKEKLTSIQLLIKEGVNVGFTCGFEWRQPLIRLDETSSGAIIYSRDIRRMPISR